jgi:hypothetical protein
MLFEVIIGGAIIVGVVLLVTFTVTELNKLPLPPPKTDAERKREEETVIITLSGM